jgi:hypothetical protein
MNLPKCNVVGIEQNQELGKEYDTLGNVTRIYPKPETYKAFASLEIGGQVIRVQLNEEDVNHVLNWISTCAWKASG